MRELRTKEAFLKMLPKRWQSYMRFLLGFLFLSLSLQAKPLKIEISAKSAILINADTGAILYEKEAHEPSYPASITKIATALYALEKKGHALDETATATRECVINYAGHDKKMSEVYGLAPDGTNIGLRLGETLSLRVLLYGLLLSSGNDAANLIARHVSGDFETFMKELNDFLISKGIRETNFINPHGYPHLDHRTTAYDMAFITKEALKYPLFREIVKTTRYLRPKTNKQAERYFVQGNRLVKPGPYYYPKAIGIKTGYHGKAGCTIVSAAVHEGRTLIAVLLGCPSIEDRYRSVTKLFETAFNEKPFIRTLFAKIDDHFTREVKGGKTSVDAILKEDLKVSYFPAEEPEFKAQLRWSGLKLPIIVGQEVGRLEVVTANGKVVQSAPLFASKNVDKTVWKAFSDICVSYRAYIILFILGMNVLGGLIYYLKKPKKVV